MARWCRRCNRKLDKTSHDIERVDPKNPQHFQDGVDRNNRPIIDLRNKGKLYGCRVRLIAQSPLTGKILVPHTPRRIVESNTRYVHESRLQPGGDLA